MVIFKKIGDLKTYLQQKRADNQLIGFVPTMGALHSGHISLANQSIEKECFTVASIFVNPTQFNDPKDFEKYPITIENDIELLEKAGCHVLFLPSVADMYPFGTNPQKHYELGLLETFLDGKYRPGHFQGVCQVVERLLQIVEPNHLFMGQKDYQQCMVVNRLLQIMNKASHIKLHVCNTLREQNGLAMSSRNMRLTADERNTAGIIFAQLNYIKNNLNQPFEQLKQQTTSAILNAGFNKIDYIEICNAITLEPITETHEGQLIVVLIAAFLGNVRLIDNLVISQ